MATGFDTSGTYYINTDFSSIYLDKTGYNYANGTILINGGTNYSPSVPGSLANNFSTIVSLSAVTPSSNTTTLSEFDSINVQPAVNGYGTLDQVMLFDTSGNAIQYIDPTDNLTKQVYLTIFVEDSGLYISKGVYTGKVNFIMQLSTTYNNSGIVVWGGSVLSTNGTNLGTPFFEASTSSAIASTNIISVSEYYRSFYTADPNDWTVNGIGGIYLPNTIKSFNQTNKSSNNGTMTLVQSSTGANPWDKENTSAKFNNGNIYNTAYETVSYYRRLNKTAPEGTTSANDSYYPMLGTVTFNIN